MLTSAFWTVITEFTSDLNACAEVYKQAVVDASGGEIMEQLHLVLGSERKSCLNFDYQLALDPKIRVVNSYLMAFIQDRKFALLSNIDAQSLEFKLKSILVHLLKKTWAKDIVDFVSAADDFVSKIINLHSHTP